jgi:hypothetical protein
MKPIGAKKQRKNKGGKGRTIKEPNRKVCVCGGGGRIKLKHKKGDRANKMKEKKN